MSSSMAFASAWSEGKTLVPDRRPTQDCVTAVTSARAVGRDAREDEIHQLDFGEGYANSGSSLECSVAECSA